MSFWGQRNSIFPECGSDFAEEQSATFLAAGGGRSQTRESGADFETKFKCPVWEGFVAIYKNICFISHFWRDFLCFDISERSCAVENGLVLCKGKFKTQTINQDDLLKRKNEFFKMDRISLLVQWPRANVPLEAFSIFLKRVTVLHTLIITFII